MERKYIDYIEEEHNDDEFGEEGIAQQRKPHKGGRIIREEPLNLRELEASPLVVSCFIYVMCNDFVRS